MSERMQQRKNGTPNAQQSQRVSNPATARDESPSPNLGVVQRTNDGMMPLNGEQVNHLHQTIGTQATIQLLRERQANYKPTPVMKAYVDPNPPWVQRVREAQDKDGSSTPTDHRSDIQRSFDERLRAPAAVRFPPTERGQIQRETGLSQDNAVEKRSTTSTHQTVIQREDEPQSDAPWYWRFFQNDDQIRVRQFYEKNVIKLDGLGFWPKIVPFGMTVYGRIKAWVQLYNAKRKLLKFVAFSALPAMVSELMQILSNLYPLVTSFLNNASTSARTRLGRWVKAGRIKTVENLKKRLDTNRGSSEAMFGRIAYRREQRYQQRGKIGDPDYKRIDSDYIAPTTTSASLFSFARTEYSEENFLFMRKASELFTNANPTWGEAFDLYKLYIEKDVARKEINIGWATRDSFDKLIADNAGRSRNDSVPKEFFDLLQEALSEIQRLVGDTYGRFTSGPGSDYLGGNRVTYNPRIDTSDRSGGYTYGKLKRYQNEFDVDQDQLTDFDPSMDMDSGKNWYEPGRYQWTQDFDRGMVSKSESALDWTQNKMTESGYKDSHISIEQLMNIFRPY
ncbi:MAG: hypothetical protein AAF639_17655 [Chloroflexota bacterium]